MINQKSIDDVTNRNVGFFKSKLSADDYLLLNNLIESHFEELLIKNNLDPKKITIKNYLNTSNPESHSELFKKKNRILPKKNYEKFIEESFLIKNLKDLFHNIHITDEENLGYGNIYWRLVRPHPFKDVGPFHKDKWGWDLSTHKIDENKFQRCKIWISITGGDKLGFKFLKNSVNSNFGFKIKEQSISPSFSFRNLSFDENNISVDEVVSLKGEKGTFIIFHDELLHTGEVLFNNFARLSIEFTFLIPLK
jgi:hypothetical protein